MQQRHRGVTLTDSEADELRALVQRLGENEARAYLRIAPQTMARAIAQMYIQRGSAELIRSGLRAIQEAA